MGKGRRVHVVKIGVSAYLVSNLRAIFLQICSKYYLSNIQVAFMFETVELYQNLIFYVLSNCLVVW